MPNILEILNNIRETDAENRAYNEKLARIPKATRTRNGLSFRPDNSNPFANYHSDLVDIANDPYMQIQEAVPEEYWQAAIDGNWNFFDLPANMEQEAFNTMDGTMWKRARKGFWQQGLEGFTQMAKSWKVVGGLDSYHAQEEMGQSLAKILEDKGTTIYQDPTARRMAQKAYWAQQLQSMGLSAGIMAEQLIETGALWALTQGAGNIAQISGLGARFAKIANAGLRSGKLVKNAEKVNMAEKSFRQIYKEALASENVARIAAQTGRPIAVVASEQARSAYKMLNTAKLTRGFVNAAKQGLYGATMGMKNAYLNMGYTEDEVYTRLLSEGMDEGEARIRAEQAGRSAYYTELIPSMLINSLQFGVVSTLGKQSRNAMIFGKRVKAPESITDILFGGIKNKYARFGVDMASEAILEGAQEGWEEFASMRGQELAYDVKNALGREFRDKYKKGLGSLSGTDHIKITAGFKENAERYIDNMIGGAMGGLLFGLSGRGFSALGKKINKTAENEERNAAAVKAFQLQMKNNLMNTVDSARRIELKKTELMQIAQNETLPEEQRANARQELEALRQEEEALQQDIVTLFSMARTANATLSEDSEIDYVADVATQMGQQIDAVRTVLGLSDFEMQNVLADEKKIEENNQKKGTDEYVEEDKLELKANEKNRKAYEALKANNTTELAESMINEDGTVNRDAATKYQKSIEDRLEEWGLLVEDFTLYCMKFKQDTNAAIMFAKLRHDSRVAKDTIGIMIDGINDLVNTLKASGKVRNPNALWYHIHNLYPDLDLSKIVGFDVNKMFDDVNRAKKELSDLMNDRKNKEGNELEALNKLIDDKQKELSEYEKTLQQNQNIEDESNEPIIQELRNLKDANTSGQASGSYSQGAKDLFDYLELMNSGYNSTMEDIRTAEAKADSLLSLDGYKIFIATQECAKYERLISIYHRAKDIKKAIDELKRYREILTDELISRPEYLREYETFAYDTNSGKIERTKIKSKQSIQAIKDRDHIDTVIALYEEKLKTVENNEKLGKQKSEQQSAQEEANARTSAETNALASQIAQPQSTQNQVMSGLNDSLASTVGANPDRAKVTLKSGRQFLVEEDGGILIIDNKLEITDEEQKEAKELAAEYFKEKKKDKDYFEALDKWSETEFSEKEVSDFRNKIIKTIIRTVIRKPVNESNIEEFLKLLNANRYGVQFTQEQIFTIQRTVESLITSTTNDNIKTFRDAVNWIYVVTNGNLNDHFDIVKAYFDLLAEDEKPEKDFVSLWTEFKNHYVTVNGVSVPQSVASGHNITEDRKINGLTEVQQQQQRHDATLAQHDGIQVFQGFDMTPNTALTKKIDLSSEDTTVRVAGKGRYFVIESSDRKLKLERVGNELRRISDIPDGLTWSDLKNEPNAVETLQDQLDSLIERNNSSTTIVSKFKVGYGLTSSEALSQKAFDLIHNPKRIKRVFVKHISDKRKELEYRCSISYRNSYPLLDYLKNLGLLKQSEYSGAITAERFDEIAAAIEEKGLWNEVFSQSYTPIYAEDVDGKEVLIGFMNSKSYFRTRTDENDTSNDNTIPSWRFDTKTNSFVNDIEAAQKKVNDIHGKIDEVTKRSLSGEVELECKTDEIKKSNNYNIGVNRSLTKEERESALVFPAHSEKTGKSWASDEHGNGGEAVMAMFGGKSLAGRSGSIYIELHDELNPNVSVPAYLLIPGIHKVIRQEDGTSKHVLAYEIADSWDLEKESKEFYDEITYRLADYFMHRMFKFFKETNPDETQMRSVLASVFADNNVRVMFHVTDIQTAIDGFIARYNSLDDTYDFEKAVKGTISPKNTKALTNMRVYNCPLDKLRDSGLANFHLSDGKFLLSANSNDVVELDFTNDNIASKMAKIAEGVIIGSKKLMLTINNIGGTPGASLSSLKITDSIVENFQPNDKFGINMCGSESNKNVTDIIKEKAQINIHRVKTTDASGNPSSTLFAQANITIELKNEQQAEKKEEKVSKDPNLTDEQNKAISEADDIVSGLFGNEISDDVLHSGIGVKEDDALNLLKPNEIEHLKKDIVSKAFEILRTKKKRNVFNMSIEELISEIREMLKEGLFNEEIKSLESKLSPLGKAYNICVATSNPNASKYKTAIDRVKSDIEKMKSLSTDKVIDNLLKNDTVRKGRITRFLMDILGNKTEFDVTSSDSFDDEDHIEEVSQKISNPNILSKKESYESSEEQDVSTFLKAKLSFIKRKEKTAHGLTFASEYESLENVLNILRGYAVASHNFNGIISNLKAASQIGADNKYIIDQLIKILQDLPEQYKNELAYKTIRSRINMMYVMQKNGESKLVAIDVSQFSGRVFQKIADYMYSNPYLTKYDERERFVIDKENLEKLHRLIHGSMADKKAAFEYITGYQIGANTLTNNEASGLLEAVLKQFDDFFNRIESLENDYKALDENETISELMVFEDNGPGQKPTGYVLHKYMNRDNKLMKLLELDCALNVRPIEAQFVVGNKNVLLTSSSTLKNKVFDDINSNGDHGMSVRQLYGKKFFQLSQKLAMPLQTGLVSISAIDNNGRRSDRITRLTEAENEATELMFSQSTFDSRPTSEKMRVERFDGEMIEMDASIRYGYETGLTNSNKGKLSWVKLPKISARKSVFNESVRKIIDYMTEIALGNQIERFFNEMSARILTDGKEFNRDNIHYNFNMSDFNLIEINIDGKTMYLSEYLYSIMSEVKDIQTLKQKKQELQNIYQDIFASGREIMRQFMISEMKERVGDLKFLDKLGTDEDVKMEVFTGDNTEAVKKGSWCQYGILDVKDDTTVSEVRTRWMDKELYYYFMGEKATNVKRGFDVPMEFLIFAAFDRVSNGYIADLFVQDTTYGSLNAFEDDSTSPAFSSRIDQLYRDINERRDNNEPYDDLEAQLRQIMYELTVSSAKSAGRVMNKRMAGIDTGGNMLNFDDDNQEFTYLVIQETKSSISKEELEYQIRLQYGNVPLDNDLLEKAVNGDKASKELLITNFPKIKDYLNVNTTDGQEFITWKEYIDCSMAKGDLSKDEFDTFNKIKSKLEKDELLDNDEIYFLNTHGMNAQKPVYNGTHVIRAGDSNQAYGLQNMYVKSSAVVLIPQLTKGLELDNVRRNMESLQKETGKNVRLAFNSAVKVNTMRNAIKFSDLKENPSPAMLTKMIDSSVTAQRKYLSIQQETDNHFDYNMRNNTTIKRQARIMCDIIESTNGFQIFDRVVEHIMDKNKNPKEDFMYSVLRIATLYDPLVAAESQMDRIKRLADKYGFTEALELEYGDNLDIVTRRILDMTISSEGLMMKVLRKDNDESVLEDIFDDRINFGDPRLTIAQLMFEPTTTEIVEATQLHNLLMADGYSKITEEAFEISKEILSDYGINYDNSNPDQSTVKISGKQLAEIRKEMYRRKIQREKERLLKEFGIEDINDLDLNNPIVLMKLQELIVKSFENIGVSDNTLQQLGIMRTSNTNGQPDTFEFNIPLLFNASSQKIESLLMSVVRSRICKSRINGNAYYVASSDGFLRDDRTKVRKMTNEELSSRGVIWLDDETAEQGLRGAFSRGNSLVEAECAVSSRFTYLGEDGKEHVLDFYETETVEEDGKKKTYFTYFKDRSGNRVEVELDENGLPKIEQALKNSNGGFVLNEDMIDKGALEMMTLRIPTSGHMSCVKLVIKAFLPPAMGETIIVPKQNTPQLGEDFDIDKRFCYFRNCIVDPKTKKIRVVNDKYIREFEEATRWQFDEGRRFLKKNLKSAQAKIKKNAESIKAIYSMREDVLKEIKELEKEITELTLERFELNDYDEGADINEAVEELKSKDIKEWTEKAWLTYFSLSNHIEEATPAAEQLENLKKILDDIESDIQSIEWSVNRHRENLKLFGKYRQLYESHLKRLNDKKTENQFIDVYLSVFGSNNPQVQKEISKVLGWDLYDSTKQEIIALNEKAETKTSGNEYKFGTPFKKSYQQRLRKENSDSQMGVGISSNNVVMTGLLQQGDVMIKDFSMDIGGIVSDGNLSNPMMNGDIVMTKSEENAALQNINLDTVKADIIGFINQNKQTYNFYCMMCLLGFGPVRLNENSVVSIASFIAIQDIVKDYTTMKADNENDLKYKRSNKSILEDVLKKYKVTEDELVKLRNGLPISRGSGDNIVHFILEGNILRVCDKNNKPIDDYSSLNIQSLASMYRTTQKTDEYCIEQLKALSLFMRVDSLSRNISKFQKLMNASSAGIGKNFIEVRQRIKYLNDLGDAEKTFTNITKLIGDFITKNEYDTLSDEEKKEFFTFDGCDYCIKPTTIAGHTLLNALETSQVLIGRSFGYNSKYVNLVLDTIEDRIGQLELYAEDADKLRRIVMRDFRQYMQKLACDRNLSSSFDNILGGRSIYETETMLYGDPALQEKINERMRNKESMSSTKGFTEIYNTRGIYRNGLISSELLTFPELVYFLKMKKFKGINENLFFKMFEEDPEVVRVKMNVEKYSQDAISQAFLDMLNDDTPISVQLKNGDAKPLRCYLGDGIEYVVTPSFLARLFIMNSMVGDNANGVLDYKNLLSFDAMDYFGIPKAFRTIYQAIRNSDADTTETDDVREKIFVDREQNGIDEISVKALVETFLEQFENLHPSLMMRELPYGVYSSEDGTLKDRLHYLNGKGIGTNSDDMKNVREIRVGLKVPSKADSSSITMLNEVRDAFGLPPAREDQIQSSNTREMKNDTGDVEILLPRKFAIKRNGIMYVFEFDGISDSTSGVAEGWMHYKYKLVSNEQTVFGQNNFDPYKQSSNFRAEDNKLRVNRIPVNFTTVISNASDISRVLSSKMGSHPVNELYTEALKRADFRLVYGPKNFVNVENGKVTIHLSRKNDTLPKNYKEEITVEEVTHALLFQYIREHYIIDENKNYIKKSSSSPDGLPLLLKKYESFRIWWDDNKDRIRRSYGNQIDEEFDEQLDHIAGRFEEFLAAFIQGDEVFVKVLNEYEQSTASNKVAGADVSKSGIIQTMINVIRNILNKIVEQLSKINSFEGHPLSDDTKNEYKTAVDMIVTEIGRKYMFTQTLVPNTTRTTTKPKIDFDDNVRLDQTIYCENGVFHQKHEYVDAETGTPLTNTISASQLFKDDQRPAKEFGMDEHLNMGNFVDYCVRRFLKEGDNFNPENAIDEYLGTLKFNGTEAENKRFNEILKKIKSDIEQINLVKIIENLQGLRRIPATIYAEEHHMAKKLPNNKTLVGTPDIIIKKNTGEVLIIDLKTSKGVEDRIPKYSVQLKSYQELMSEKENVSNLMLLVVNPFSSEVSYYDITNFAKDVSIENGIFNFDTKKPSQEKGLPDLC